MIIKLNEKNIEVDKNITLFEIKNKYKSDADIIIYNGAAVCADFNLIDGDRIVLIKKGEKPSFDELESLMMSRHTPGVHNKLKKATIGIAGLGGLGSTIAISLARVGIGKLILADFDIIEPSNLNRQQYFYNQIGMLKTEAMKQNLKNINPYVQIETHNIYLTSKNIFNIFSKVDIMIEAFDKVECKSMIANEFGKAKKIPLIMASGMAGYEKLSNISIKKMSKNIYVAGDFINESKPGCGLMAPRVGVVANYQANMALQLIMNKNVN